MLKTDFEIWFRDFQAKTGKKFDNQSGIFWNMMRWEKYDYSCDIIQDVANQIVSQFEKKHDDRKSIRQIIGRELKKKRKMRIVTSDLCQVKALNIKKIFANADLKKEEFKYNKDGIVKFPHNKDLIVKYPLVYRNCSECGWFLGVWDGGHMDCFPCEGVWMCPKCDNRFYDEFYNHAWLKGRDGIKAPEIDINKIELPF